MEETIRKNMTFSSPSTELIFFEEVEKTQIMKLTDKELDLKQLTDDSVSNGDIYIFQVDEGEELFRNYKLPYVEDYFNVIVN
jgi:hypothetical protein